MLTTVTNLQQAVADRAAIGRGPEENHPTYPPAEPSAEALGKGWRFFTTYARV
jgi:hypothetical protein